MYFQTPITNSHQMNMNTTFDSAEKELNFHKFKIYIKSRCEKMYIHSTCKRSIKRINTVNSN